MKARLWPALVAISVLGALAATYPTADAQVGATNPMPGTPLAAPSGVVSYATREATAPPAIRTRLLLLRQNIQAQNAHYTVGYTLAMDRPLSTLAAVIEPPNSAQQAAAFAPVQSQLLQADEAERAAFIKRSPFGYVPDTIPPFNTASPRADWRTIGMVTPVRDQDGCGSCWAFATMGAYESSYMIRNAQTRDTSEQAVVSCSGAGSCAGGWPYLAFNWLISNGTDSEGDYPYTATSGGCKSFSPEYLAAVTGFVDPNATIPSVALIKQAIVTYGPVEVLVYATPAFQAYTGGVFSEPGIPAGVINHAVVIVGWDDAKGAWIMRNSWGTGWGTTADYGTERGYMYIAYGSNNIGKMAQWVRAQKTAYRINPRIRDILRERNLVAPPPVTVAPPIIRR